MTKKPDPITVTTGSGAIISITPTERGLLIELDDNWRLVYTSIITDNVRMLRFEVESRWRKGKETRPLQS